MTSAKPAAPAQAPVHTCLKLAPVTMPGRMLGLLPGDLLLRLDGQPLQGPASKLIRQTNAQSDKIHLLSFSRGGKEWSVLSPTMTLGRWKAVELSGPVTASHAAADRMRNWNVVVNDDGRYDAHPRTPPLLALLTPLYLLQMRLWAALAVWGTLTLLGLQVGWILGSALQILICLYVWRAAPTLFLVDRKTQGFQLWRVIAATSETDLHRQVAQLDPDLRFVFSKDSPSKAGPEIGTKGEAEDTPAI
jgi:hypothetical protein